MCKKNAQGKITVSSIYGPMCAAAAGKASPKELGQGAPQKWVDKQWARPDFACTCKKDCGCDSSSSSFLEEPQHEDKLLVDEERAGR